MKTVSVNGRVWNVSGNVKMFVHKLELSRGAQIEWTDDGGCIITDNSVKIDRPLTSLSSGHKTAIKDSVA